MRLPLLIGFVASIAIPSAAGGEVKLTFTQPGELESQAAPTDSLENLVWQPEGARDDGSGSLRLESTDDQPISIKINLAASAEPYQRATVSLDFRATGDNTAVGLEAMGDGQSVRCQFLTFGPVIRANAQEMEQHLPIREMAKQSFKDVLPLGGWAHAEWVLETAPETGHLVLKGRVMPLGKAGAEARELDVPVPPELIAEAGALRLTLYAHGGTTLEIDNLRIKTE